MHREGVHEVHVEGKGTSKVHPYTQPSEPFSLVEGVPTHVASKSSSSRYYTRPKPKKTPQT